MGTKTDFGQCPCDCVGKGRLYCFFDRARYLDRHMWNEPSISLEGYEFRTQTILVKI